MTFALRCAVEVLLYGHAVSVGLLGTGAQNGHLDSHTAPELYKVGSDESHFNVSLIVRDKVTRQCPQTTTCEEKGEPKQIRTEVPLCLTARPNRLTQKSRGCTSGGV